MAAYLRGEKVTLCPSKCFPNPNHPFDTSLVIRCNRVPERETHEKDFDAQVNAFWYYNCNAETGKGVHFYIPFNDKDNKRILKKVFSEMDKRYHLCEPDRGNQIDNETLCQAFNENSLVGVYSDTMDWEAEAQSYGAQSAFAELQSNCEHLFDTEQICSSFFDKYRGEILEGIIGRDKSNYVATKVMYYKISDYGNLEKLSKVLTGLKKHIDDGEVFLAGIGTVYLKLKGKYNVGPYASDVDDFEDFLNRQYYGIKRFTTKPNISDRWNGNWESLDSFVARIQ